MRPKLSVVKDDLISAFIPVTHWAQCFKMFEEMEVKFWINVCLVAYIGER